MSSNNFSGVCYQINVESFADGNGDGLGDFTGIINKLDYLEDLGIKNIILLPIHPSSDYNGNKLYHKYAPDNYLAVDPTIASELKLIKKKYSLVPNKNMMSILTKAVHSKNMKIIMDLVAVHSSTRHPWFLKAINKNSSPADKIKYQNYYYFQDVSDNEYKFKTPNIKNTITKYYKSEFDAADQPYLNWNNKDVFNEFVNICKYWISQGVDGFRIDAASHLLKDNIKNLDILNKLVENIKKINPNIIIINESSWDLSDVQTIESIPTSYYNHMSNGLIKDFNLGEIQNTTTPNFLSIPLNYTNTHDKYTGSRLFLENDCFNINNEVINNFIPQLSNNTNRRIEIDISNINSLYQNVNLYSLYIWKNIGNFNLKTSSDPSGNNFDWHNYYLKPNVNSTNNKLYFDFALNGTVLSNNSIGYILRYGTVSDLSNNIISSINPDKFIKINNPLENKYNVVYYNGSNNNKFSNSFNFDVSYNKINNEYITNFDPSLNDLTNSRIIMDITELKNLSEINKIKLYMWDRSYPLNRSRIKVDSSTAFSWDERECSGNILDSSHIYFDFYKDPVITSGDIGYILKYNTEKIVTKINDGDRFISINDPSDNQYHVKYTSEYQEFKDYSTAFQKKILPFICKGIPLLTYGDELGLKSYNSGENRVPMRWVPKDIQFALTKEKGNKYYNISKSNGQVLIDPFNNYSANYNSNLEKNYYLIPSEDNFSYNMIKKIIKLYNYHSAFNTKNNQLDFSKKNSIEITTNSVITYYTDVEYIYNGNDTIIDSSYNTKIKLNVENSIFIPYNVSDLSNNILNTPENSIISLHLFGDASENFPINGIQPSEIEYNNNNYTYYFNVNIKHKKNDLGYAVKLKKNGELIQISDFLNEKNQDNYIRSQLLVSQYSYPEINIFKNFYTNQFSKITIKSYLEQSDKTINESTRVTINLINLPYLINKSKFTNMLTDFSMRGIIIQ